MPLTPDPFAHRLNPDETIDSICKSCFMTVGTAETPDDLKSLEFFHVCDRWRKEVIQLVLSPDSPFKRDLRGQ
jgi:hypothetical protein